MNYDEAECDLYAWRSAMIVSSAAAETASNKAVIKKFIGLVVVIVVCVAVVVVVLKVVKTFGDSGDETKEEEKKFEGEPGKYVFSFCETVLQSAGKRANLTVNAQTLHKRKGGKTCHRCKIREKPNRCKARENALTVTNAGKHVTSAKRGKKMQPVEISCQNAETWKPNCGLEAVRCGRL